ncbi:MAG: VCBS repeat-containing protein [Flavobacteriales bacterium]|nr:VCBS repeat-containing protein [Flavobacteriales bacterium]
MRSALSILLVISHAIAHAQLFAPPIDISLGTSGPAFTQAADLDGDGDMDVLSASDRDDKIAWYANDGSGTFGNPTHHFNLSGWTDLCHYCGPRRRRGFGRTISLRAG